MATLTEINRRFDERESDAASRIQQMTPQQIANLRVKGEEGRPLSREEITMLNLINEEVSLRNKRAAKEAGGSLRSFFQAPSFSKAFEVTQREDPLADLGEAGLGKARLVDASPFTSLDTGADVRPLGGAESAIIDSLPAQVLGGLGGLTVNLATKPKETVQEFGINPVKQAFSNAGKGVVRAFQDGDGDGITPIEQTMQDISGFFSNLLKKDNRDEQLKEEQKGIFQRMFGG